MKTIYHYVLDTMADWETGHAIAELNSQRYFDTRRPWQLKTCASSAAPITTMGGLRILPDVPVDEIDPAETILLILPGADTWSHPEHRRIVELAGKLLASGAPVAAICGATAALGEAGLLDRRKHTSNGLDYLKMFCPHYRGSALYQNQLAVTDENLITAGSSSAVEFARHIFVRLDALDPESLDHWEGYFGRHDPVAMHKLLSAHAPAPA